jgi:hypothetical protein
MSTSKPYSSAATLLANRSRNAGQQSTNPNYSAATLLAKLQKKASEQSKNNYSNFKKIVESPATIIANIERNKAKHRAREIYQRYLDLFNQLENLKKQLPKNEKNVNTFIKLTKNLEKAKKNLNLVRKNLNGFYITNELLQAQRNKINKSYSELLGINNFTPPQNIPNWVPQPVISKNNSNGNGTPQGVPIRRESSIVSPNAFPVRNSPNSTTPSNITPVRIHRESSNVSPNSTPVRNSPNSTTPSNITPVRIHRELTFASPSSVDNLTGKNPNEISPVTKSYDPRTLKKLGANPHNMQKFLELMRKSLVNTRNVTSLHDLENIIRKVENKKDQNQ